MKKQAKTEHGFCDTEKWQHTHFSLRTYHKSRFNILQSANLDIYGIWKVLINSRISERGNLSLPCMKWSICACMFFFFFFFFFFNQSVHILIFVFLYFSAFKQVTSGQKVDCLQDVSLGISIPGLSSWSCPSLHRNRLVLHRHCCPCLAHLRP